MDSSHTSDAPPANNGSTNNRPANNSAPGGPPGHTSDTDWRQRPTYPCLSLIYTK
jgi:hypothetical protein